MRSPPATSGLTYVAERLVRLGSRARRVLAYHGPVGTLKLVARRIVAARQCSATFIWYALDLAAPDRPHFVLGPGLVLRRGGEADLTLVEQLAEHPSVRTMTPSYVREQLAAGAALWLVHEGDRAAFRCWIFRNSFPMRGVKGGGIKLPPAVAVLEDSLSSSAFRGRGVAPAAWASIADHHRDEGARWMYTKVHIENTASRRAVEKVGFREVARMKVVTRNWRTQIRVLPSAEASGHDWLAGFARGRPAFVRL